MSFWDRIKMFFKMKTSAAMDRAEDPREVLDYAYSQQEAFLRKVKQGLVDVATARHQLEQQIGEQRAQIPKLEAQAQRAVAAERPDLARIALTRKQTVIGELEGLEVQLADVAVEEQKLAAAEQAIAERIAAFRTQRQAMQARYTAAEAQVRIRESLTGVSGELSELSMALGRAEEKTRRMVARAGALDTLMSSGALEANITGGGDMVEQELRKLATDSAVERELAALQAGHVIEALPSGLDE